MIIFKQPQLYVKFYLFFLCTLIWLGALTSLVLWCTKYLPDGEPLLFVNFEGKDFETVKPYPNFQAPWSFSKKGVLWGVGDGFAGSAGIKLTSLEKGESYMKWDIADPRRLNILCNKIIAIPHVVVLFVGLSLFAAITEFMQLITIDRTPDVSDWLIDIAGILLGILIAWFSLNGKEIGRF